MNCSSSSTQDTDLATSLVSMEPAKPRLIERIEITEKRKNEQETSFVITIHCRLKEKRK
jgi:hypothetical protein